MASGSRVRNPLFIKTFTAGEALAAHLAVIWHATAADTVSLPAGAADTQVCGVTLAAAAAGEDVEVCMFGPCILRVDGNAAAIIAGDAIEVHDAVGYGAKRTLTDGTTLRELIGQAMEASSADGDEISVFVGKTPWAFTA